MKKLELQKFGVEEMTSPEMENIQGGGFLGSFLSGLLTAVTTTVGSVVNDTVQYAAKQVNTVLSFLTSL